VTGACAVVVCGPPQQDLAVAGTTLERCRRCAADVIVAPSSLPLIAAGADPVCIPCAAPELALADVELAVAPGAREEFIEVHGDAAWDELRRRFPDLKEPRR
jgi:hypothetical protein